MTIKLPKDLRGFAYDRVLPVELNSFDVDILLPAVFFKVISEGQDRGTVPNDPTKIREAVGKLADHADVVGFESDIGRRLLERLVRTALVQIGRRGEGWGSRTDQILSITSYSLLAFKPGFPVHNSLNRRVDMLIYRMLTSRFHNTDAVKGFFREIFGQGVDVRGGVQPDGRLQPDADLDTLTLLSIAFLDGFAPVSIRKLNDRPAREACPGIASAFARDLWRYLEVYRRLLPIEALTYHLKALINLELFIYTLKLFVALPELVQHPDELPPAMQASHTGSPPDIYLDFTGGATGLSREMAGACVRRDLAATQRFVHANLTLRQLDRYVQRLRGDRRIGQIVAEMLDTAQDGPEYLQGLPSLMDNPQVSVRIDASAQFDEDRIRQENAVASEGDDDDAALQNEEIDRVTEPAESDFERVVALLYESQRTKTGQRVAGWYWSVGGLTKPHGILAGHLKSRQSWRYAPSNDLLATLVQLAAVDIPKWDKDEPRPQPVGLGEFLGWLERRFGILVDRPPAGFAGPQYVAAAQENLRAMLRRLRQMGVFRDLSDDFTVQRLTPPYGLATEHEDKESRSA